MRRVIKIFGLHRTCTNLVTYLLRSNFKCRVLVVYPCHKHDHCTIKNRTVYEHDGTLMTDDLKYVVCTKHPFNWCQSTYTYFSVRNDRYVFKGDMDAWIDLPKTLETYNKMQEHWLGLSKDPNILQVVKSEDLIHDQRQWLNYIHHKFNLEMKGKDYLLQHNRVNPCEKISHIVFTAKKVILTDDQKLRIKERVNVKLLSKLGYSLA